MEKIGMGVGGGGNEKAATGRTGWTQAQRRQGAGVSKWGRCWLGGKGDARWAGPKVTGNVKAMLAASFYIKCLVKEVKGKCHLLFGGLKIYGHSDSYLQLKVLFFSNFLTQFGVSEGWK